MAAKNVKDSLAKPDAEHLKERYTAIRSFSEALVEPLETEDFVIQAVEHTSPTKWHLAHVSWFYETFVLEKAFSNYESMHPQYAYIFNSYYLQTGEPHQRSKRGLLSRPTVSEVFEYRKYVNNKILQFLDTASEQQLQEFGPVIEIGNHHEQQHQELMLTDLKFLFAQNPLKPPYRELETSPQKEADDLNWISFEEGVYHIGNEGKEYTYDNEQPRHRKFLEPFELSDRLITNAEFIDFIEADGYRRSELWLDEGWATVNEEEWRAPLYWFKKEGAWHYYTLGGVKKVNPGEPVTHLSYYEADAYARWADARLPTEAEWEVAAEGLPYEGNFVEQGLYHPRPARSNDTTLKQMFGDVWEWTMSSYEPYPGYEPLPGALGEYNGKFMCSQYVLRGGSCATSQTHIRKTYRNFFYPDARWQFNGFRLARNV
ncbi:ergothioneine biosynthesis protein EgtB [Fodinibius salsisoli]|uniref:Ergothioneine biosynthesis protein EgtB n=1 Tax=Fodinibius salsisoli TaxID=2820877 RepID=A0ABT3PSA7_9BACT|nr:ergothioneine biosynthesis protein EgtB [Fodinibius salsisoli]MCW9708716.1 ergothioneine biosynthesis protein EgtB [Fodinibius salsisoli]